MTWIVAALLSAFFAALVAIFGKIGVKSLDVTLATTVRAIVMAIVLTVTALSFGKGSLVNTISGRPLLFLLLSGLAGAASWLCYFYALKWGPASGVASLDRLSVVFVLVLAIIFLGEALSWRSALGAAFVAVGAILMVVR
jgi:transporter family protein